MEDRLREVAVNSLKDVLPGYTVPEALAMVTFRMLEETNGLDLATIILRGKLMRDIEVNGRHEYMPGAFATVEEAIEAKGHLSRTQQSIIRGLRDVVFPYVQDKLGMSIPEFWSQVGKSNAQEIIPHLKSLITGEKSKSEKVNKAVAALLEEVGDGDEEETKQAAIEQLLEAAQLTNNQLRAKLDPSHTPSIPLTIMRYNGSIIMLAEVSDDQLDMLMRVAGTKIDPVWTKDSPDRIPLLRKLGGYDG